MRKPNDLSRSLIPLDLDTTLIAVVELSLSSWLVAGIVPGVERPFSWLSATRFMTASRW
jgi:transposase